MTDRHPEDEAARAEIRTAASLYYDHFIAPVYKSELSAEGLAYLRDNYVEDVLNSGVAVWLIAKWYREVTDLG